MTNPDSVSPQRGSRGRLAVVSGFAHDPMSPRGQRTQNLVADLSRRWDVELVALPAGRFSGAAAPVSRKPLWRRALGYLRHWVVLDRCEQWAIRRLSRWRPEVDAALLVAYPWSPATRAARRLRERGIPYVIDAGDPWVLTETSPLPRSLSIWRSRRAEAVLWRGAAGAVLTTRQQAERLEEMFPHLQVLVRPNGYEMTTDPPSAPTRPPRDPKILRLAHFGTLSRVRVDIAPILAELQRSGHWRSIIFAQFGDDYVGMLERVPEGIRIERHATRPWSEVLAMAGEFDAAVVLGNQLGYLLPSKAVQYLTLPIPRLAVTGGSENDALADFATSQPGWLVTSSGDPQLAERLAEHVEHEWRAEELSAPISESWPEVATEVSAFVERCVCGGDTATTGQGGESTSLAGRSA